MSPRVFGRLSILLAPLLGLAAGPSSGWEFQVDGALSARDEAEAVGLDSRGFLLAAGRVDRDVSWLVAKLSPGEGGEVWRAIVAPAGSWVQRDVALAIDAADDLVLGAGFRSGAGTFLDFILIKLRGADGTELWRYVLDNPGLTYDEVRALAVDGEGNVLATGFYEGNRFDIPVVKVSGSDGTQLWVRILDGGDLDYGRDVAVDAADDVFVVGDSSSDLYVAKLSGTDGSTLWEASVDGGGELDLGTVLEVDAAGDVVVGGMLRGTADSDVTILKFAGGDGTLLWQTGLCCATDNGMPHALALSPAGDVVVGGEITVASSTGTGRQGVVAGLRGSDGAILWSTRFDPGGFGGQINAVGVDATGDVMAAGTIELNDEARSAGYVRKLHPCGSGESCPSGGDGFGVTLAWDERFMGVGEGGVNENRLRDLVIDADGSVVVAGAVANAIGSTSGAPDDFFVAKLSEGGQSFLGPEPFVPFCSDGRDNDGDGLVDFPDDPGCTDTGDFFESATTPTPMLCTGRRLLVKDRYGLPKRRAVVAVVTDPMLPAPGVGSPADPRSEGAVLEVVNRWTGESTAFNLPAAGWEAVGEPEGAKGFRYRDGARVFGPCRSARFRQGRLVLSCKGHRVGFSLNEPFQGALAARLHLPNGDRVCTEFGGNVRRDRSTTEGAGIFLAQDAPPPFDCDGP